MSNSPRIFLTFLVLQFIIFIPCAALSDNSEQTTTIQLAELQKKYRALQSLSFSFLQETRANGRSRTGKGHALFIHPQISSSKEGQDAVIMRWDYTDPDPQVILNNGKTLTIYTEKDNQAIITPVEDIESDLTHLLFTGTRNIVEAFMIESQPSSASAELTNILLIPRQPHRQLQSVRIWFDKDLLVRRLLLLDHFDTVTDLMFTNLKVNPVRADDHQTINATLDLKLPPATEIITQEN
ncbi:MAG: hypothetical protein CSA34_07240 [Desulfobulbus propionicus]|nr:MAG: hypothetical protein CSA34_07240 [Desulfobulbus propionicus]